MFKKTNHDHPSLRQSQISDVTADSETESTTLDSLPQTQYQLPRKQQQRQRRQQQIQDHRSLIIHGIKAPPQRYPYFVLLNGGNCGGSLIAPDIVLTAGHCLPKRTVSKNYTHNVAWAKVGVVYRDDDGDEEWQDNDDDDDFTPTRRVILHHGDDNDLDTDEEKSSNDDDDNKDNNLDHPIEEDDRLGHPEEFLIRRAIRHHKYHRYGEDEFRYDYTIIQLEGKSTLPYISLLRDESILEQYSQVTAIGLGWTKPDHPSKANWLHEVNLTWINNTDCSNVTDGDEESYSGRIDKSHFCTFEPGKDSCAYDSGSPLIITTTTTTTTTTDNDHHINNININNTPDKDFLVAQVSWGMECADEIFPAVNARLSTVLKWIDDTVCAWSVDPPVDFGCFPPTPPTADTNNGTTALHQAWESVVPILGNVDFFLYVILACLFATCGSRLYWRRRRHEYEALK